MSEGGFLAIWSDVPTAHETDYLHWLTREHTAERLGVPGFLSARVFRARGGAVNRYFILYGLESAAVVGSSAYLERLNHPTPWSRRIMPLLGNFARGGGRIAVSRGTGEGAVIAAIRLDAAATTSARDRLEAFADRDRIVRASLLEVDHGATGIPTSEKALRQEDRGFDALLVIEGLDDEALSGAWAQHGQAGPPIALYDQIFSLR